VKIRNYKVLGVLALPVAALAVAAVMLSMSLGSNKTAEANQPNAGLEWSIAVGGCSSAGDAKGNCVVNQGSTFNAVVSLDSIAGIGNGSYDAIGVTVNYTGVASKDNPDITWSGCAFEAPATGPGFVNAGCAGGISAPPSTVTGPVFDSDFNCTADGTLTLTHGAAETLIIDSKGKTSTEAGPDVLNIDCAPAPTATPVPPTATPPDVPQVQKDCDGDTAGVQTLCNVFLTRQGTKIPPVRCDDSTDVATLTETVSVPVASINQKGELQDLAAFEFEVRFDWTKVCVNLAAAGDWVGNPDVICTVRDKDSSTLEGIAQIGCVTIGKGVDTDGLILATIEVRPQPELYSQLRPNQDNGNAIQVLNQGCELADEQGHAIPIFSCEDADITFRYLEGDVDGPDCDVDVFDTQQVAFRWGVNKGSLLYNSFMDLEPSGQVKGDGDIDIKDIQFVFGRFASTCDNPWPAQVPVNPKA
jgi:hypothetical protein